MIGTFSARVFRADGQVAVGTWCRKLCHAWRGSRVHVRSKKIEKRVTRSGVAPRGPTDYLFSFQLEGAFWPKNSHIVAFWTPPMEFSHGNCRILPVVDKKKRHRSYDGKFFRRGDRRPFWWYGSQKALPRETRSPPQASPSGGPRLLKMCFFRPKRA